MSPPRPVAEAMLALAIWPPLASSSDPPLITMSPARPDWSVAVLMKPLFTEMAGAEMVTVALRLGSRNKGPGKMPAPYEDSPTDIWGQTREEWRARRGGAR